MGDPQSRAAFRSLSSTLIRSIVTAGAVCALVVAGLQLLLTYHTHRASFQTEIESIAELNVPLLSVNLWDIEPQAIRQQLKRIADRPQIAFARLEAVTGQEFQSGNVARHAGSGSIALDVPYPSGKEGRLGTLTIVPDWSHLYSELAYGVLVVLAASALLTAMICYVVAVILKRQLQLPMQHIASFAGSLTPAELTRPLELDRPRRRWRDEIDEVADGFRVLQEDIRRHVQQLDQQVAQRTAELKTANERLEAMAQHDPLTGLANRRRFDREKLRAWEDMLGKRQPLSVLMLDIDYFKHYNDTYGHGAGDECLVEVARVIGDVFQAPGELPVRMGGEEFAVLLENVPHEGALERGEWLRRRMYERNLPHAKSSHGRVTISVGVSSVDVQALPGSISRLAAAAGIAELLGRADQALYEAKAAGRNTVVSVSISSAEYVAPGERARPPQPERSASAIHASAPLEES
ncbi:MAG TPA: diguanylate cyclase [Burkholderiales bacterium]|nr:diguanylate cyclase [Burkholderiales bacterium]